MWSNEVTVDLPSKNPHLTSCKRVVVNEVIHDNIVDVAFEHLARNR